MEAVNLYKVTYEIELREEQITRTQIAWFPTAGKAHQFAERLRADGNTSPRITEITLEGPTKREILAMLKTWTPDHSDKHHNY